MYDNRQPHLKVEINTQHVLERINLDSLHAKMGRHIIQKSTAE